MWFGICIDCRFVKDKRSIFAHSILPNKQRPGRSLYIIGDGRLSMGLKIFLWCCPKPSSTNIAFYLMLEVGLDAEGARNLD